MDSTRTTTSGEITLITGMGRTIVRKTQVDQWRRHAADRHPPRAADDD